MLILIKKLLQFRTVNYKIFSKRNQYIVLLPEVPPDTPENNPLLRASALPAFSQLNKEKCVNAVGKLVIEYEAGIHHLDQKLDDSEVEINVQNVILPLDRLTAPLDFAWGVFKLLYTVHQNESIAEAYVKLHPRIIKAKREKYLSPGIYKAFKELKSNEKKLTEPVRRILDKHILESHLSGMDLSDKAYQHLQSIMLKLDQNRGKYKFKLMQSTSAFSHELQFDDVKNFPSDVLKLFASDPTNVNRGPWTVTLEPYVYNHFMEYCENRLLRWNAWFANNIRATSTSGELNNSLEVEELRLQRTELAKLLGFDNFAQLSMKTKMAGSVENVMELLTTLHVKSKDVTLKEIERLEEFARANGFPDKLQLWDIPYWQRLHKEDLFSVDEATVRQYFPLPAVLEGAFTLFKKLFGITIQEVKENVDVWHQDVSFYKITDENGKQVASFYLDPYMRTNEKTRGAWLEIGRNRSDVYGSEPLSYLVFNFHPPSFGKPSLLSFADLKNLFQKLGHLLQHSLTTVPYTEVAGLTNLEWDVVNVCPLVMSSFLGHYDVVGRLSRHVDSGDALPAELHRRLVERDQYMMGLRLTEELFLSALDLELYNKNDFWLNATKKIWDQYMPFPYEKNTGKPCSFPEIFSDQFPAAYFSNLWAEMIAADVFSAFVEEGLHDDEKLGEIGRRFRDTYLSLGGGCGPGEVFRKFRGRDPCADALLAGRGLLGANRS